MPLEGPSILVLLATVKGPQWVDYSLWHCRPNLTLSFVQEPSLVASHIGLVVVGVSCFVVLGYCAPIGSLPVPTRLNCIRCA